MDIESLRHRVPADCWDEFRTFLTTGEASESFLTLLDEDPDLQVVAEEAFDAEASRFERFAAGLQQLEAVPARGERTPELLSSELARTMRRATTLPLEDQHRLAQQTANTLRNSVSPTQRQQVSSMVSQLGQALKP